MEEHGFTNRQSFNTSYMIEHHSRTNKLKIYAAGTITF